jgi:sec-independent protein translocase protein TatC
MPRKLRPIGHEDRLSLVDHLDELRRRLIYSIVALVICFGFCFWQNNAILSIVTKPVRDTQNLKNPSKKSKDPLEQSALFQKKQGAAYAELAPALSLAGKTIASVGGDGNLTSAQRQQLTSTVTALAAASKAVGEAAQALPKNNQRNLITLGVTEPFTATITVAFYAALLLCMPFLLYQAYAFVLPAFSPKERKVALPLMLMVPFLFVCGVLFGYFVVLERAVHFLQNFNDNSFDILLQANQYFKFAVLFVAGIGLLFQIPVGVLAVTRLGIFTPKQLAKNRGYVILAISILAAVATPTPDPFTMGLAMAPLIVLFELSILLARWVGRIRPQVAEEEDDEEDLPTGYDDDPLTGYEDDDDELDMDDDPVTEAEHEDAGPDLEQAAADVQRASEAEDDSPSQPRPDGERDGDDPPKLGDLHDPDVPEPKD